MNAELPPQEGPIDWRIDLDGPCLSWGGYIQPNGYGSLTINCRSIGAHRAVWESLIGEIPPGLHLDHLCRNPCCVNVYHLEPVTPRVNIMRGICPPSLLAKRTHCNRGHEFTPENTYRRSVDGYRQCKICQRGWANARHAKKRLTKLTH